MVLNSVTSPHSKRAYEKALTDFMNWWVDQDKPPMVKATVQEYRVHLEQSGLAPSTVNQRMSAIRKLASEAADNGLMSQEIANEISKVKGVKMNGERTGYWFTKEQAQELINAPNVSTLKGLRDRAILAVMLGAGLRRSEVADLAFNHVQQREGRWVIVEIVGKGNRVRIVPIPSWVRVAIDEWSEALGDNSGYAFRPMNKGGRVTGDKVTPQLVFRVVAEYAGEDVSAHDLRHTFAKLAHKGGAPVDQIQLSLGHASLRTTERYLGLEQDLTNAPCDHLGLKLED